jgi:hypothetical protein
MSQQLQNSEVLPSGEVAVAEMTGGPTPKPFGTWVGIVALKKALPSPSVVTVNDPM